MGVDGEGAEGGTVEAMAGAGPNRSSSTNEKRDRPGFRALRLSAFAEGLSTGDLEKQITRVKGVGRCCPARNPAQRTILWMAARSSRKREIRAQRVKQGVAQQRRRGGRVGHPTAAPSSMELRGVGRGGQVGGL